MTDGAPPQFDPDGRELFRRPPPRSDWLALRSEPVLEPDLPIIDPHHHIWTDDGGYLAEDALADMSAGHRIVASVFMQSHWRYAEGQTAAMQPVGEVAAVAELAAREEGRGRTRLCAGIVGFADMELGDAVAEVLEAQILAGNGRFRGIRHATVADPHVTNSLTRRLPADLMERTAFRRGIARLQAAGLSFDAWLFHPQIPQLTALARAFPDLPIILDHLGGPLGVGHYSSRRDEVWRDWCAALEELATCPNVFMKVGGLGMVVMGFGFHRRPLPPTSEELAQAWRPYVDQAIETFGPRRCMFESNFPVDKGACSYANAWNAFKRLTGALAAQDRAELFAGTAARVYRLSL